MRRRLALTVAVLLVVALVVAAAIVAGSGHATPAPAHPYGVVTTAPPVCDRDPSWLAPPDAATGTAYWPQPASSYDPEVCR
jgi:hypothetical protein